MQLMNVTMAADLLGVSAATVRRLVRDGEIPSVRVGRSIRIRETALEDWVAAMEDMHAEQSAKKSNPQ